jgi:uncharacterized membrane protein YhaH (DUF805 family)
MTDTNTNHSRPFAYPTPFNWSAPIGRLQYVTITLAVVIPYLALQVIAFMTAGAGGGSRSQMSTIAGSLLIWFVIMTLQAAAARRLVDLGRSRWWLLAQLIPLLNVYVWGYLFFAAGKSSQEDAA